MSLKKWETFVKKNINNEFVKNRKKRNITSPRQDVDLSKERIWRTFIRCQITSVQKSGPNSKVSHFLNSDSPSPVLNYKYCLKQQDKKSFIQTELLEAGIRFHDKRAVYLSEIIKHLESGGWKDLNNHLETLRKNTSKNKERKVADYLRKTYLGLGPKQSRNFIQDLGLSRYEIPIDSRIIKTMKKLDRLPVPNDKALSSLKVYIGIQDRLQDIASKLEIYPCILDACIFSSFDKNKPPICKTGSTYSTSCVK